MNKTTPQTTENQAKGIVSIHGKDYVTVARRVELAHEAGTFEELFSEVLSNSPVVIRATVTIKGKKYTGISSVSLQSDKMIEKSNPYEVAETSAVGRALGFAGYGIVDGIASADEVTHAVARQTQEEAHGLVCESCGAPAVERRGISPKSGKPYRAINCSTGDKTHTKWINEGAHAEN